MPARKERVTHSTEPLTANKDSHPKNKSWMPVEMPGNFCWAYFVGNMNMGLTLLKLLPIDPKSVNA
jgi:hypothetical protein